MSRRLLASSLFLHLALALAGCSGSTGREPVEIPIHGAGVSPAPFAVGSWTVTLEEADVGFGSVYFCSSPSGTPDLCATALLEYTPAFTIDGLDPAPSMEGVMTGVTGTVRSTLYDHAIGWWLTQNDPAPLPGAPGGHSTYIRGYAENGLDRVDFIAPVDVLPPIQGSNAVIGVQTTHALESSDDALVVRIDPSLYFAAVDFDLLFSLVTMPGVPVVVEPGTQAYEAIVFEMTTNALPSFEWAAP